MKRYTVKSLYRILGQALKNIPFIITYHGKPRAVVLGWDDFLKTQPTDDVFNDIKETK